MSLTKDVVRRQFRRDTKAIVQVDAAAITLYAGEPYYDTTDGHVWISNGTSINKIDARAIVSYLNEPIFFNDEAVLF